MLLNKNAAPEVLAKDEKSGDDIVLKKGRFGPYLQCGKKMKSLPPNLTEEDINLENAIKIISLPKDIGKMANSDDPILVDIGRYGPYVKAGKISRSISKDKDSEYSRHISWVTKDNLLITKEHSFDKENKLLKEKLFEHIQIKTFNLVSKISVTNVQKQHSTILQINNLEVDSNIGDDIFNELNLKRSEKFIK